MRADDGDGLLALATTLGVDLAVIGPEAPLVAGVADELRHAGVRVFGPSAEAARIEGSKLFAKEVMAAAGVPMAAASRLPASPCVVKADGLAAGKGVFVCRTDEELEAGLRRRAALGGALRRRGAARGPRGLALRALRRAQRRAARCRAGLQARATTATSGPNTGGMGAYSPVPSLDDPAELVEQIHQPVLDELARRRTPFVGCLFAGLMLTESGPRVLEFNARFGDPETQALFRGSRATCSRRSPPSPPAMSAARSVREGDRGGGHGRAHRPRLPGAQRLRRRADRRHRRGRGGRRARLPRRHRGRATAGSSRTAARILSLTALAPTLEGARERAYAAVGKVSFEGMRFRTDIASSAADG